MNKEKDIMHNIAASKNVAARCLEQGDEWGYNFEMENAERLERKLAELREYKRERGMPTLDETPGPQNPFGDSDMSAQSHDL